MGHRHGLLLVGWLARRCAVDPGLGAARHPVEPRRWHPRLLRFRSAVLIFRAMNTRIQQRRLARRKNAGPLTGLLALAVAFRLPANPTGMTVVSGSAAAKAAGSQLNITVSQNAFLNWSSFNIQNGETTTFIQP